MVEGIDLAYADWEIQVLGQFSVTKDRQPVALPQASKRLLAWLAVYPRPQPRASVAARLWPDLSADRAAAAMRTALWTLNRAVGIALRPNPAGLQLDDRAGVDLWRCLNRARLLPRDQDLSASSTGNPEADVDFDAHDWPSWVEDFSRDLLPEWSDDWLVLHRERHRQVRMHALEDLCRVLTRTGRTAAAIEIALEAVAADPLRESAQRLLIGLHLAEGNLSEAVRQYRAYDHELRRQLGVSPSRELAALLPLLHGPPARASPLALSSATNSNAVASRSDDPLGDAQTAARQRP